MKLHIHKHTTSGYWMIVVIDANIEFIVESKSEAYELAIEVAKTFGLPH